MGLQLLHTLQNCLLKQNLLKIGFPFVLGVALTPRGAEAQVVPDGTLKSTVETIQELMKIDGGLTEGSNLFHSFEEFNIPEGMEASFENAVEIENIFTRVTGDSASTINGTLSAQGGANLFLMNPNGIVFGQDASINIGGSFIATTADSIQFQDGTEFAATSTEDETPLLVNKIPIGLGFGSDGNSGEITLNGEGNEITPAPPISPTQIENSDQGLEVSSGNTLGLVGSGVTVDGGTLTAESGNIELGSVGSGVVGIQKTQSGFDFDYSGVSNYQNIDLSNLSLVNADNGGEITTTGADINLTEGSSLLIQNQDEVASGNLTVNANSALTIKGNSSDGTVASRIQTEALGNQQGANITISSPSLVIQDGTIGAVTYGSGSGGNIIIDTDNSVQMLDNSTPSSFNLINASTYNSGDAGDITISTSQLSITEGSSVASSTLGIGEGGNIAVDADSIKVDGIKELVGVEIPTQSNITTSTVDASSAGTITLNSSSLELTNGGAINSSSFANGNAGEINIKALESVEVSGRDTTDSFSSVIDTSVINDPIRRQLFGITTEPSGNAGNVTIDTPNLDVNQGGIVSVANEGSGNAGTLSVNADEVNLDDNGSISAASASGQGGNINLNTENLRIDNQSTITTEAENQGGGGNININATNISAKKNSDISANATGGDGGNININTETLLGLQNSDITANAVEGDGGNINITATSILGYEEREPTLNTSDISASSEFGVDGNININSPETNAEEDVELSAKKPEAPLTPLEFVKGCQLPEGILTTRGRGVPESPYPFPFGYLSHDRDVYKLAEETLRKERERKQRSSRENGISKREAEERRQERELAMLREKQRLLPNRHEHLKYEVTDDREVGPMLLPAPKGKLVEPADGRTDKNAIPAFYSQSNELPPISREKRLRQEGNVLVINPDGSKHFVRMFLMSHPTEEMCQSTVGRK